VYKVIALQPHCSSQLFHQLPSASIAPHRSIIMTAFLRKSKATILELMKTLPNTHIAAKEDFVMWGRKFVRCQQLGGWMY
jgi:hypothetical protein